ncbi:MAG: response regulator [Deltaproteobacteria bacterium]
MATSDRDPARTRTRILFVDDEPSVLSGLRRILRPMRGEWEMSFAESGAEALDRMAAAPYDVVVSDMRMPGMDGLALLREVRKRHPQTISIILSGQAELDTVLHSVEVVHQYIAKPVEPETLKETLGRARAMHALVSNERLRSLLAQMKSIPSLPEIYHEIMQEIQSPEASLRRIGGIIARDIGMSAKILQLANSAFFGAMHRIADPVQAASFLGLEVLKALVISVQIFSRFEGWKGEAFSLEALWEHSFVVGADARAIAREAGAERKEADVAFMGGVLHDVGKLILAVNLPGEYREVVVSSCGEGIALCRGERERFGATHAEVGAYLLGIWGIPRDVVEAVAFHHEPGRPGIERFAPMVAVHVANAFSRAASPDGLVGCDSPIDRDFLERAGLAGLLPRWEAACRGQEREERRP